MTLMIITFGDIITIITNGDPFKTPNVINVLLTPNVIIVNVECNTALQMKLEVHFSKKK